MAVDRVNRRSFRATAFVLVAAAVAFAANGVPAQEAKRTATDAAVSDAFGGEVAVSGDSALVGAYGKSSASELAGVDFVFTRTGTTCSQEARLTAADAAANDRLGASVSVEGDRAFAGAHGKHLSEGAAYGFTRTGTSWSQTSKLTYSDPVATTFFGFAVDVSGDTAVATAFGADGDRGAAYVFDVTAGAGPPPGWCLPAKVTTKINSSHEEKSKLTASGTLDTGAGTTDFSGAATFEIGGFRLIVPEFVRKGASLTFGADGVTLKITPSKTGSSRTAFSFKATGDVEERVFRDGPLAFCFANSVHTLTGTGTLAAGALGPRPVVAPSLAVVKAAATVKGGGKDALKLTLGFASGGVPPAVAEDLTISFGGAYTSPQIAGASFVRKGDAWTYAAKAPGITKATVDFAKGTITIAGSGLDLGAFAAGGNAVDVTVTRGADVRSVGVLMGLAGTKLTY